MRGLPSPRRKRGRDVNGERGKVTKGQRPGGATDKETRTSSLRGAAKKGKGSLCIVRYMMGFRGDRTLAEGGDDSPGGPGREKNGWRYAALKDCPTKVKKSGGRKKKGPRSVNQRRDVGAGDPTKPRNFGLASR